jgi:hypothetical protein
VDELDDSVISAKNASDGVYGMSADNIWASIASRYSAFGSPLVPCIEDVKISESAVIAHAATKQKINAIMLGVTPALALMNWPVGSKVTAIDRSAAVIASLWPGNIPNRRTAICGSWFSIPRKRKSCDVVIGDGSLISCRFPDEARTLFRALSHLLTNRGLVVLRLYLMPKVQESVCAVMDALKWTNNLCEPDAGDSGRAQQICGGLAG